ncbi:hypothetical protein [Streptomyces sp. NPDC008125]|uniref:hypothetical protein n=1 Tax=Streptomyces sp. NPDC008125 TaxID=3364811 RepID=UPI0036E0CFCF
METGSTWLGLACVVVTTLGTVGGTWLGRTRVKEQEVDGEGLPGAPPQPEGTWTVSPEMYRWFQDQMTALHGRLRTLEDAEREARTRADRTDRLLGLALDHISVQDERLRAAGMPLVPMAPELVAARDAR